MMPIIGVLGLTETTTSAIRENGRIRFHVSLKSLIWDKELKRARQVGSCAIEYISSARLEYVNISFRGVFTIQEG